MGEWLDNCYANTLQWLLTIIGQVTVVVDNYVCRGGEAVSVQNLEWHQQKRSVDFSERAHSLRLYQW